MPVTSSQSRSYLSSTLAIFLNTILSYGFKNLLQYITIKHACYYLDPHLNNYNMQQLKQLFPLPVQLNT